MAAHLGAPPPGFLSSTAAEIDEVVVGHPTQLLLNGDVMILPPFAWYFHRHIA